MASLKLLEEEKTKGNHQVDELGRGIIPDTLSRYIPYRLLRNSLPPGLVIDGSYQTL